MTATDGAVAQRRPCLMRGALGSQPGQGDLVSRGHAVTQAAPGARPADGWVMHVWAPCAGPRTPPALTGSCPGSRSSGVSASGGGEPSPGGNAGQNEEGGCEQSVPSVGRTSRRSARVLCPVARGGWAISARAPTMPAPWAQPRGQPIAAEGPAAASCPPVASGLTSGSRSGRSRA